MKPPTKITVYYKNLTYDTMCMFRACYVVFCVMLYNAIALLLKGRGPTEWANTNIKYRENV